MNHYRKKTYYRKRNYNNRSNRRYKDTYHQPSENVENLTPYSRHTLTKGDVEAVVEAMLSGTLTQGKELDRFESLLAKLTHCHYALAVNSGTAAIHTVLAAIGLEPGDEVVTSTLNFSGIANMVKMMGGVPVLVDCDPETLTISVEEAAQAVTPKTKAIFANNFAGQPADMFALRKICDEHSIALLEDACHGLGGRYRGHYTGNQADMTCFSFHPTKAITSGEGGAITTNDIDKFAFMKMFRHHGIQDDADYFMTEDVHPGHHEEVQFPGMNYKMCEMQAALGRNQLTRLDRHLERRRAIAQVYNTSLSEIDGIILPQSADWADHAFHLYPIQFSGVHYGKRDTIFEAFKSNAVDVQVHYVPVHLMPLYREENAEKNFPNAESYYKSCISLPLYPDLSIKEIDRIVDILKKSLDVNQADSESNETASDIAEEPMKVSTEPADVSAMDKADEADAEKTSDDGPIEEKPSRKRTNQRRKTTPYRRRNRKPEVAAEVIKTVDAAEGVVESKPEPKESVEPQAAKTEKAAPPAKISTNRKPPARKTVGRKKLDQPAGPTPSDQAKPVDGPMKTVEVSEAKPEEKKPARKRVVRKKKPEEEFDTKRKTTSRSKPAARKKAPVKADADTKAAPTKRARRKPASKTASEPQTGNTTKTTAPPKTKKVTRTRKKKVEPETKEDS